MSETMSYQEMNDRLDATLEKLRSLRKPYPQEMLDLLVMVGGENTQFGQLLIKGFELGKESK